LKQEKAGQSVPAQGLVHDIGRNQQRRAGKSDQHAEDGRPVQPRPAGQERFDARQPERTDRNKQAR